ncbi:MAG TPA: carotenoid oxygenase family protein [Acidimicrobiia bacterium]|nr:carotenoid oxygenase family protein [Acidimicrobiia bacterium]
MSTAVENRYLVGNFAPVKDELTATDLPTEGAVPTELRGRLLRIGPNPIAPDPAAYHWFTGDGMIHAIELRDGKAASYRNRWVRTDQAIALLGEDAIPGQPDDVFPAGSSVANTHIVAHAGKIFALVEVCLPTQVSPDLSTVGRYDFGGKLRSSMTAHPKMDPVTGEMLFFGYDPFGPPWLRYHVVNAAGELVRSEDIDIQGPSMVHDFAITERHVVFFDLPVVFDFDLLGKRPFPAAWKPDYGARVGVMPRDGGNADVRWFEVDLCYVFHPLNAYDENGSVVVDVARHPKMFDTDIYGPAEQPPTLDRWTIDLDGGKVIEERIDDRPQEFPRVDDRVVGRQHRYGYATYFGLDEQGIQFGGLLRHDLRTGAVQEKTFGAGTHAGEGVFVPASHVAGEDEGWVLTVVYDEGRDASDLFVLDATDFAAPPVGAVHLPQRVPFGFHGSWVPDGAV